MSDYEGLRTRFSPWSQLSILLLLCGFGIILGSLVSILVANSALHVPLEKLPDALKTADNANLSRALQFISTFFIMALPSFVFARIVNRQPLRYIGFNASISGKQVFLIVCIIFMCLFLTTTLSNINEMIPVSKAAETYFKSLEEEYYKQMMVFANMKTIQDYIIALVVIALLPAIFEEMLFRGALQPVLINLSKSVLTGILVTSILFSAIHASFYGFLPRLALGIIIGYIFCYSKNLWLASITHFLYNAYGVTQMYALSLRGELTTESMSNDPTIHWAYGLLAAVSIFMIFKYFKRESEVVISMYNHHNKRYL